MDDDQARRAGVQAVPAFVIDGRYAIAGAQSPSAFVQALEQVAAEAGKPPRQGDSDD